MGKVKRKTAKGKGRALNISTHLDASMSD